MERSGGAGASKCGDSQAFADFSRQTVRTPPGCRVVGQFFRADDHFYGSAARRQSG